MSEVWKKVVGWDNYEVSDHGNVRAISGRQGVFPRAMTIGNKNGYGQVRLTQMPERRMMAVHRLVAFAFIPNPLGLPLINHIDNNPANNHVSNLEWCTQKQNLDHARKQGRMRGQPKGTPSPTRSLDVPRVLACRRLRAKGLSYAGIADKVGTNKKTVMNICRGVVYADIR